MSALILSISHSTVRELRGIYALIYYVNKIIFNAMNAVIIKRGRASINKMWIWGKRGVGSYCSY
jgi:hypothetical protein